MIWRKLPKVWSLPMCDCSDNVRNCFSVAWNIAETLNHSSVTPEHLLAALIDQSKSSSRTILYRLKVTWNASELNRLAEVEKPTSPLDFAPSTRSIIDETRAQARRLNHPYVGTEHLLLALITGPASTARSFLEARELTAEAIRKTVNPLPPKPFAKEFAPVPELSALLASNPRIRVLRDGPPDPEGTSVVYWMQRAQRGIDNFALNHAIKLGNALKLPVLAVFGLTAAYPGGQRRHFRFLVDGLPDTQKDMEARGVPLVVRIGTPNEVVEQVCGEVRPAIVVSDENPIHVGQKWRDQLAEKLKVPFRCVDADVVVPTSLFPKEEFAARTIRPKIHRVWNEYLKPMTNPKASHAWKPDEIPKGHPIDPDSLLEDLKIGGIGEVPGYHGGSVEALRRLRRFVKERLPVYATERNEPVPYNTTELSAHLHFGHISPLTIALAVMDSDAPQECKDSLLEELIVRREVAINFVSRNPNYDKIQGCPDWGLKTLAKHADDHRPVLYSAEILEAGETGDPLWNASQKEMVLTGRMHNYLRMYWAKKILEWSPDAETAFDLTLSMNDRYEMDGRDPNGYTGVAWAIGGKHDRPWGERPIFGMIRFMSYESTRKKFDSNGYIKRVKNLERS